MPWPDEPDLGEPVLVHEGPGRLEWQQPLRARQLESGYLPMPLAVTTGQGTAQPPDRALLDGPVLRPSPDIVFRLEHDGHPPSVQRVRMDEEGRLVGLQWPSTCFPGILLDLAWQRGSRTVQARTTALLRPRTVDGESIEHRYDQRVRTRDGAWQRPPDDTSLGRTRWLVMTAVRRFGLLDVVGRAMLARELLASALPLVMTDAPEDPTAELVGAAVVELLAAGALTRLQGSRGDDGRPHHPTRLGERIVELLCYTPQVVEDRPRGHGETEGGTSPVRAKAVHHVPGFLRYIGHLGYEASPEQRRLFRQDFLKFGLVGSSELPPATPTYGRINGAAERPLPAIQFAGVRVTSPRRGMHLCGESDMPFSVVEGASDTCGSHRRLGSTGASAPCHAVAGRRGRRTAASGRRRTCVELHTDAVATPYSRRAADSDSGHPREPGPVP